MSVARRTPRVTGINERSAREDSRERKTIYWRSAVAAGVRDLIVCMKETGTKRRDTFPRTILKQKTTAIGRIL